ncbi:hypothetical protein SJAG_00437 [Schizosaccharomyces japonicus yFS275]|uniref:Mannosyltransferase n=1 Tax=Schizosaccharomyces japonicus (strain yFS275 / FY16936) TaxID=402676 RepID=B6JVM2_SCHJY|nr:hypothetical protein SJAG_00437 [Schizosaccharomyces japonicus yFS275]EEB05423.2 hypothetical protein SJAG_00437 [Schizosaccharomyces japonicus yFS275]
MKLYSTLLLGIVLVYAYVVPYTKVEESFSIQAIHDIQHYGVDLTNYDHFSFPGPVKRSFIPSLVIAILSWFPTQILTPIIAVRLTIGFCSWSSLNYLATYVDQRYGKKTASYFLLLLATQFHLVYYMSRPLANVYALITTNISFALILSHRYYKALAVLVATAVIVRSEVALLLVVATGMLFLSGRILFWKTIRVCLVTFLLALFATVMVDSWFWQEWNWPEGQAFVFNVIAGKSSDWGTSPWYTYFLRIPWLLMHPFAIPLIVLAAKVVPGALMPLLYSLIYVSFYSALKHKEWRFIIYVLPYLTVVAAMGVTWVRNKAQSKSRRVKKLKLFLLSIRLGFIASACMSLGMLFISYQNYPGASALQQLYGLEKTSDNISVHSDVYSCMTGVVKLVEKPTWSFDKTEDPQTLTNTDFFRQFEYVLSEENDLVDLGFTPVAKSKPAQLPIRIPIHLDIVDRFLRAITPRPVYVHCKTNKVDELLSQFQGQPVNSIPELPPYHRIISPGAMVTKDYRPERINIHITENGLIKQITHG